MNGVGMIHINLGNFALSGEVTGIGQYALNLLDGFAANGDLPRCHLLVGADAAERMRERYPHAAAITTLADFPWPRLLRVRRELLIALWRDQVGVRLALRGRAKGLLFHPFQAKTLMISRRLPTVVTMHDLLYRNFPPDSRAMQRFLDRSHRAMVFDSRALIVPSAFVCDQLHTHFPGFQPDKVHVIHNPIRPGVATESPVGLPRRYILGVNALSVHKNVPTLLRAFARIEQQVEHALVLVGSGAPDEVAALRGLIAELGLTRVHLTGYLNDGERNALYRDASLFVTSSCHEGFGMTPIEAALFDVPVLVARATSLPEVTLGQVAEYAPATDAEALAQAMLDVLANPPDTERLRAVRTLFAERYDYRRVAAAYMASFDAVLKSDTARRAA